MSKNMMRWTMGLLVVGCVLATACPASAEVIFNGSGSPADAGYNLNGSATPFTFDSPSGFMHQDVYGGTAYWKLDSSLFATEMVRVNGWIVETRLKMISGNPPPDYGVFMMAGDNVDGVYVNMHPEKITVRDYANTKHYIAMTADVYHTIRVAMAPGGTKCDVYVDDMTTPAISVVGSGSGSPAFGDGCGSTGGEASWDYFNIRAIPEPGTMALLATGLIGLLCYAWRKQK